MFIFKHEETINAALKIVEIIGEDEPHQLDPETIYFITYLLNEMELIKIRNICNISIEEKRANKEIGSSLEANLNINLDQKLKEITKNIDFSELCITSKAEISFKENLETSAQTTKAKGKKCSLCWKINENACHRTHCPQNF